MSRRRDPLHRAEELFVAALLAGLAVGTWGLAARMWGLL